MVTGLLLFNGLAHALDVAVARRAEEQARFSHQMAAAARPKAPRVRLGRRRGNHPQRSTPRSAVQRTDKQGRQSSDDVEGHMCSDGWHEASGLLAEVPGDEAQCRG